MYFKHFGLARSPFEASGLQPFYINESYREAFVALRDGIELRLGLVVMTGESGVGKSTLITLFQNSVKKNVQLAVLSARSERPAGLLFGIIASLGLHVPADLQARTQTLKNYLSEQSAAGQIVAIIIDDAEELSVEDFAELNTLLSLRSDGTPLLQIVLVGSPALASPDFPGLQSLRQRVGTWSRIPPLPSHEVEAYIEHKLSFAGSLVPGLFPAEAVARIAAYSQGIPKTIDALCDRSLRLAYPGSDPISKPMVEDESKILQGGSESSSEARPYSDDPGSRSRSEAYTRVAKTWGGMIRENVSGREARSRTGRRAAARATASRSWIPQASQRLKSLVLSTPIREYGRLRATAAGVIVIAALAAVVVFRPAFNSPPQSEVPQEANYKLEAHPGLPAPANEESVLAAAGIARPTFDPPRQPEAVQQANTDMEADPAPPAPANEESALRTESVQTRATAGSDTVVPKDDPAPQLQRRAAAVQRPGELVFLHTSQLNDFPTLEDIGAVLRNEGYDVRDTRFTTNSTQGDVRFFFTGDRRAAEQVRKVVEAQLQSRGYSRRLQLLERDGRKFRFAAPGKIEVWLPPLTRSERG